MAIVETDFQKILTSRHATRQFDPSVTISRTEMLQMLDEAMTAPSALNRQPWRVVVIDSDDVRKTLKPLMGTNGTQNQTASALVLFLADLKTSEHIGSVFDAAVSADKMSQAARDHLEPIINKIEQASPKPALQAALSMDTALAIMQFMLVAQEHGYDTGAMTGFDHDHIVSALDLDADRYAPVMLIAVGKAVGQLSASYREPASQITTFK
ncbi:nitroreductase family protein [Secundilactobacillus muriivasis]